MQLCTVSGPDWTAEGDGVKENRSLVLFFFSSFTYSTPVSFLPFPASLFQSLSFPITSPADRERTKKKKKKCQLPSSVSLNSLCRLNIEFSFYFLCDFLFNEIWRRWLLSLTEEKKKKKRERMLLCTLTKCSSRLTQKNKKNPRGACGERMKSYCIGSLLLSNRYLCIWLLDCLLGGKQGTGYNEIQRCIMG